jgi:hypothetical protein
MKSGRGSWEGCKMHRARINMSKLHEKGGKVTRHVIVLTTSDERIIIFGLILSSIVAESSRWMQNECVYKKRQWKRRSE